MTEENNNLDQKSEERQKTPAVQEENEVESSPSLMSKIMKSRGAISHIWRITFTAAIFITISWLLMKQFSMMTSCITAGVIALVTFFISFVTRSKKGYEYFDSYANGIYMIYTAIASFVFYFLYTSVNQELLFWIALAIGIFSINTTFGDISGKKLGLIVLVVGCLAGLGYFLEDSDIGVIVWPYTQINNLNISYDANVANIGLVWGIICSAIVLGSFILTKMIGVHRAHNKTIERYRIFKGWETLIGDTRNVDVVNRDYSEFLHGFCDIRVQNKEGKEIFRVKNVFGGWFQLQSIKDCLKIEHVFITNKEA